MSVITPILPEIGGEWTGRLAALHFQTFLFLVLSAAYLFRFTKLFLPAIAWIEVSPGNWQKSDWTGKQHGRFSWD